MTDFDLQRVLDAIAAEPNVKAVAEAFNRHGTECVLVGGSVRNGLLGIMIDDWDYATPATVERMRRIGAGFGTPWEAGVSFGTLGYQIEGHKVEITTYRAETYEDDSRKPTVTASEKLEDDLIRRDFTVNAMAVEVRQMRFIDPFNGMADLRAGILRTPGSDPAQTMSDDPLRMIRAARFATLLNMRIEPGLAEVIRSNGARLGIVAPERIGAELVKVIKAGGDALATMLEQLVDLNLLQFVLNHPALASVEERGELERLRALVGASRSESNELTGALWRGALALLAAGAAREALSGLKPTSDELARALGSQQVRAELERISESCETTERALAVRKLVRASNELDLRVALILAHADPAAPEELSASLEVLEITLGEIEKVRAPLPVTGNDALAAGLRGREIGAALSRIEEAWLVSFELDRDGALELLAQTG